MRRRENFFLLSTLPIAIVTVTVMNTFGWGESGFAAAAIGIPLMLLSWWVIDPYEIRRRRPDRQRPAD